MVLLSDDTNFHSQFLTFSHLSKNKEKYVNESSFIRELAVLIYAYTLLFLQSNAKSFNFLHVQSAFLHLILAERLHAGLI